MNVFLWILQIVLAAMFALAGVQKSTQPKEKLVTRLPWVEDFSAGTVRLIGIVELLGAIGLVLPAALDIAPVATGRDRNPGRARAGAAHRWSTTHKPGSGAEASLVHIWSTRHRNRAVRSGLQRYIVRAGRKCDPAENSLRAEP